MTDTKATPKGGNRGPADWSEAIVADLRIPDGVETMSLAEAAGAYVEAGWYIGPIARKTRHAGSILGKGWPAKTSNDPAVARSSIWENKRVGGLFLHVGRSGAIVFDVDEPPCMPEVLREALFNTLPAYQSTRPKTPLRGHWVFSVGEQGFGNGLGSLRTKCKWGDVRGRNGIIVVAPTPHPGGYEYRWRIRRVPPLPDELREALQPPPERRREPIDPFMVHDKGTGLLTTVRTAVLGECNEKLFWAACRFGEMVLDGVIDEDVARSLLAEAAIDAGMDFDLKSNSPTTDYLGTIESGLRTGRTWPE
jgi:hypothetical protein